MLGTPSLEVPPVVKQIHPMVRQIVGRCHVGNDYGTVRRYVVSRFNRGYHGFRALDRKTRRAMLRDITRAHSENRDLYRFVMGGHAR